MALNGIEMLYTADENSSDKTKSLYLLKRSVSKKHSFFIVFNIFKIKLLEIEFDTIITM
jgi:hypothetical protein